MKLAIAKLYGEFMALALKRKITPVPKKTDKALQHAVNTATVAERVEEKKRRVAEKKKIVAQQGGHPQLDLSKGMPE